METAGPTGADLLSALKGYRESGSGSLEKLRIKEEMCDAAVRRGGTSPCYAIAELFFGQQMLVDLREEVSRKLFTYGVFEADLSEYVCSALRPGMCFFDVGAHYGYFSLLASHLVGQQGKVLAFEPTPDTATLLRANLRGQAHALILERAVLDRDGPVTFNSFGVAWSAFNSIAGIRAPPELSTPAANVISVMGCRLDSIISELGVAPDMIKIDAESSELSVLTGGADTLSKCRPIITVEVGDYDHLLRQGVPPSHDVLAFLLDRRYELFEPHLGKLITHKLRGPMEYGYENIVAVPQFDQSFPGTEKNRNTPNSPP
jgi:FkbM family methyltransferase